MRVASAVATSASKPAAAALARWRSMKFRQLFSSPCARASNARERSRGSSWSTKPGSVGTAASRSIAACASCWSRTDSTSDQQFDQNGGGPSAPDHVAALVRAVHDCPRHFDGTIEIAGAGLLHRKLGVDDRQRAQGEPLRHGGLAGLGEQVEARLALRSVATNQSEASAESAHSKNEVVAGTLGDPQRLGGLAHGGRIGQQRPEWNGGNVLPEERENVARRVEGSGHRD